MKYWLLSDPHFHHPAMLALKARPVDYADRIFKSMKQIPATDTLICLGDLAIWKDLEVHQKYIMPLKCRKILVKGNHDKKSNEWYLSHGWDFVCRDFHDKLFWHYLVFSHIPVELPATHLNIHGHLHARAHRAEWVWKNCALVSCELQWYCVQTLKSFLKNRILFSKITANEKEASTEETQFSQSLGKTEQNVWK